MIDGRQDQSRGKLVVGAFLTLDGVMQAPGSPEEDRDGGFEHGGWMDSYSDERMREVVTDQLTEAEALLLGRKTYEIFASYWPHFEPVDDPLAMKLNGMPKYVASRTLETVDWSNSTLLEGDIVKAVRDLKDESGGMILVQGSADLIQTLLTHELIDEFRLWVFPLVLGDGKQLFSNGTIPTALKLMNVETSTTGVVMLRYRPTGEIEYDHTQ
ncbi:dihydrofolate reductase family protein [Halomarina rubra]|uniref:Dihydrofolate reductase family protein n=1 Tax=Halomarina rubra TaxID=2071873 RepID=A0ABD6AQJ6_9EURY|nr:dihydrofolate reductase family protein [Halomarina rubra]